MMVHKNSQNKAFNNLNSDRRTAVKLLFEDTLTDEEIAKKVNRSRRTLAKWKKDPLFVKAQREYSISQLDNALPDSIKELIKLIKHGKSEMVKLQAIQTVFKRAGLFSDVGSPDLDKAKVRKAIAEARISEHQADRLESDYSDDTTVNINFDIPKEDKDASKS